MDASPINEKLRKQRRKDDMYFTMFIIFGLFITAVFAVLTVYVNQ